jgi:hypothetical protein
LKQFDYSRKIALKVLAKMIAWTEEYAWQEFVNVQKGIKENIAKTQHVLMNVMDTVQFKCAKIIFIGKCRDFTCYCDMGFMGVDCGI